ncbi:arsenate reductase/protein-tyrosine-phosphatase family protein [Brachybacterium aquaticum]|uniref:protein-tyrosine-phosphatase n=1 Tax=Brachybacterium aquaticum TaxID=1432564 RepID=A0A841ACZ5_9MICO|nr:hypothetical protein [Brachybacterium aquaticum]MBB5832716.1 protein-tyrosine phosphatase [Brachybacterium aquaticum]
MTPPSILTLCTANICRSPVAQAVLGTALAETGITVTSAGTHAATGASATPEAISYTRSALGTELEHVSRRLDSAMLLGSDLVLTMTVDMRGWAAREEPRSLRRTFTLLELARIVPELSPAETFADMRQFAHRCARLRTRVLGGPGDLDIADPYGGPAEGYTRAFTQVHAAAGVVAQAIIRTVEAARRPAAGTVAEAGPEGEP